MTSAQTDEGEMVRIDCICYINKVGGEFDMGMSESYGVTIRINKKGSMDMEEFAKFLHDLIMPFYPNVAPEFGRWFF